jgi:hypothetical protein
MSEKNTKKALFESPFSEVVEPLRLDKDLSFESSDIFLVDKLSNEEFFGSDEYKPDEFYFEPNSAEFLNTEAIESAPFELQEESKSQEVQESEEKELNYSLFENRFVSTDKSIQKVPQIDSKYEKMFFANSANSQPMLQNRRPAEQTMRMNETSSKYVSEVDTDETRLDASNFQQILKPVSLLRNFTFMRILVIWPNDLDSLFLHLALQYRNIFAEFPFFNYVQSTVYDDVTTCNPFLFIVD